MDRLLASWFGTGLILRRLRGSDLGSGTLGAAFALVLSLALRPLGWPLQLSAAALVTVAAAWSAGRVTSHGDEADPSWVVVDEAAGALWATVGLTPGPAMLAWAVFRVADIFKRGFPGVSAAERLPGGFGVTADDVVAGAYGLAAGWIVTWLA